VRTADFLARALYTAALFAYTRCFGTGKRSYKLKEDIFTGDAEYLLEKHEYYTKIRDRHLAHSVNSFEHIAAVAAIKGLDTDKPEISHVGSVHVAMSYGNIDEVAWLMRLSSYLLTIVTGRWQRAQKKLEEWVKSLPTEELKKLEKSRINIAAGREAAKAPRQ
jgi:hypothetical protein